MSEFYLHPSLSFHFLYFFLIVSTFLSLSFFLLSTSISFCSPDDVLCKIATWTDDTALHTSYEKWWASFWFWSIKIWYLKLSIHVLALEAVIQNYFRKSCFKDLKLFTEHLWNFTKMYYKINFSKFIHFKQFQFSV